MKRITACFLLAVICVSVIVGCGKKSETGTPYYSFEDDLGYEVSLFKKPERVAVLFSSYAEIWTLAGGEVFLTVGESVERDLVGEETLLVDNGAGKTVNTELLISYAPDLVIASADIDAQISCREVLSAADIPIAYFRVDTFEDYLETLKVCSDITENTEAYKIYGEEVKSEIDECILSTDNKGEPKILFIRAGSKIAKAKTSGENFVCDMLKELGAVNIAEAAPVLVDSLSVEEIIKQDPRFIFVSTMGDEVAAVNNMEELLSQPAWETLTAVNEGRVFYLPKEMFQYKPNHRWAEAYSYLAEILYG